MNLDDWRSRINDLDNQILDLLTQRAEAALQIGDLKRRQDAPSYAPEREADIVRRLTEQNDGPLAAEAVVAVWREILSGCRALEAALTVAYLGPQATFTHDAALQHFGAAVAHRPAPSVVEGVDDGQPGRAAIRRTRRASSSSVAGPSVPRGATRPRSSSRCATCPGPSIGSWSRSRATASTSRRSSRARPGRVPGSTSSSSISRAIARPTRSPRCCVRWGSGPCF